MISGKPRLIVSYDTIIHPFDLHTWLFTSIFIIMEVSLLLIMQVLWSHASGKPLPSDYIFQGLNWRREGFKIRKILILKWFLMSTLMTMAYKSTLLSSLITARYESPIDTLIDLERSGLPVLIPKNTPLQTMFAIDPRTIVKRIYNNSFIYNFNAVSPMSMPIWEM